MGPVQFGGLDDGLVVQNWLTCGPFGGPGVEKFNWDGGPSKDATRKFFDAAHYPPDETFDPRAVYTGPQVQGHWAPTNAVRWRPARVDDLDTRVKLGQGAEMWYAATWIYSPHDTSIDCSFRTSRMAVVHFTLNGEAVDPGKYAEVKGTVGLLKADMAVKLKKGWNEVLRPRLLLRLPAAPRGARAPGADGRVMEIAAVGPAAGEGRKVDAADRMTNQRQIRKSRFQKESKRKPSSRGATATRDPGEGEGLSHPEIPRVA